MVTGLTIIESFGRQKATQLIHILETVIAYL